MRKLLIAMLLMGSVQLLARTPATNIENGKQLIGNLQQIGTAALFGTAIAFAVPQVVAANDHVTAVTAEDPISRHSVMLLRSDDIETGGGGAFHFVHVGSDAQGNAVLLGREVALGSVAADYLGEGYNLSLYGWDGLIADNLIVNVIQVFEDKTDGIFNVVGYKRRRRRPH